MAKARPDRIHLSFSDTPAPGAMPLDLAEQRLWPAGLLVGVFFAVFAGIWWGQFVGMNLRAVRDVFDLMFALFHVFWLLGWSVGVLVLGLLTALLLFYRESARIEGGRLLHVPRLGPLKIICEYELARVRNVRLEPTKHEDKLRVRFDYGNGMSGIGDAMPAAAAEALAEKLRAASRDAGSASPGSGRAMPERAAATQQEPAPVATTLPPRPASAGLSSGLALVGANLLPLAGVLVFGWDLANVMVLYWAESAVIGVYTLAKVFVVGKWVAPFAGLFFVGHFGGFMAVHFLFVYGLFVRGGSLSDEPGVHEALLGVFGPLWPALLAFVVSHGVSFVLNFIRGREYAGAKVQELMAAPYKRIMIMHVTIIFGGWVVLLMGTPVAVLAVLVVLKTAVDWQAHVREHSRAAR